MAQPEQPDANPGEKLIYLPEPAGHRRSQLMFVMGGSFYVDQEVGELAQDFARFMAGDAQLLRLKDASLGNVAYLTREGAKMVHLIQIAYIANPAPELSSSAVRDGKIKLARGHMQLPNEPGFRRRR